MDAHSFGGEVLFGNTPGYDACGRLSCGGSASSAPVADTVFEFIDLVGVPGAVGVFEPLVVLRTRVFVPDDKGDRSP